MTEKNKLPSDENLLLDGHLRELGGLGVNGGPLGRVDGTSLVDRVADDVDDAAEGLLTDRDPDGGAGVKNLSNRRLVSWPSTQEWPL